MFVVPFSPVGTPAVIMIKSPLETLPVSTAVATALLSNASVFLRPSLTTGLTPQTIAH